jgi:hypothetical protein
MPRARLGFLRRVSCVWLDSADGGIHPDCQDYSEFRTAGGMWLRRCDRVCELHSP